MLGLRVRGRGGWDRTAAVAAPKSAFLWGSTPFLCARAKKWGGTGRASAVYCPRKRRTRVKRKTRRPRHCAFCVCADTLGGGRWLVLRFDPISLVLAQRNGVEPPKKSAFLPRRLHHPRERCCLGGLYVPRPTFAKAGAGRGRGPSLRLGVTGLPGRSCRPGRRRPGGRRGRRCRSAGRRRRGPPGRCRCSGAEGARRRRGRSRARPAGSARRP